MASPPSPPYDNAEDPLAGQKMMHGNSIPEPSESPKSQLHDAIERIQSLHKRRAQIKTIYENERQYLDQRSQKTKSSFEGLIVSTEEQIQSINEFPAFDSHPDYTEVNGKLHSVALDTKALFQNVNALSESIIMALDAWYQKEFDKCAYEIKLAEKDYKRSFDTWQDLIKSGDLFGASEPFKSSAPTNPGPSSSRSSHQLQDGPDPHMYASAPVSNPNIPIPHKSDTVTSQHNNIRPQSSRNASIDMGANMSGAMMGGSMNGRGNGNGNANANANMNGDMNYPPNSSEKRSGGKKKTFSWLSGGSGNGKYIE